LEDPEEHDHIDLDTNYDIRLSDGHDEEKPIQEDEQFYQTVILLKPELSTTSDAQTVIKNELTLTSSQL
jgi:hypothetical protein